ncbi:MAG: hypothetical protein IJN77_06980 [Oscillospiraceae bacterium]|nr:hypothetical protein [Oscillospiraceae bacterium]
MTEYTKLTESEKQEIVKEYKKRFNTAIAIEISAILLLGIMVLVKEYFNVKVNTIYALMTVPVIIFCFGCAMQVQLLKCPVCGKNYPHTFDRFKTYPARCPNCGVFLGDKIDAVNEHISQQ